MSPADQLSTLENAAADAHSHPPNLHKPPVPPTQPHQQLSVQSPPPPQSTGSLLYPTQGPGPNPQAHVAPPPYKIDSEELSKEDVIFF